MSVLIKGMEMPKNCLDCPLQGGIADCRITQKTYNWGLTERPSDCPLIEVPKHGRLIDADCCNDYFYEHMSDDMMIAAMNAINEMPTIIESESEAKHTFSPSEPMTNADRIRAMTDEELARYIVHLVKQGNRQVMVDYECGLNWLREKYDRFFFDEWLKQGASE